MGFNLPPQHLCNDGFSVKLWRGFGRQIFLVFLFQGLPRYYLPKYPAKARASSVASGLTLLRLVPESSRGEDGRSNSLRGSRVLSSILLQGVGL